MTQYLLAIDQGTTSTRAIVFDETGAKRSMAQVELPQHFPCDGWVEHDAMEIWWATETVCRDVLRKVGLHATSLPLALPISVKPRCCGTAATACRCIKRLFGKTVAPQPLVLN